MHQFEISARCGRHIAPSLLGHGQNGQSCGAAAEFSPRWRLGGTWGETCNMVTKPALAGDRGYA